MLKLILLLTLLMTASTNLFAVTTANNGLLNLGVFAEAGSARRLVLEPNGVVLLVNSTTIIAEGSHRIDEANNILIVSLDTLVGQERNRSLLSTFIYDIANNTLFIADNGSRWIWLQEEIRLHGITRGANGRRFF